MWGLLHAWGWVDVQKQIKWGINEDVLFFNNELDKIQMIELIFQHMVKVVLSLLPLLAIIVDKSQVETEVNMWIIFFLSFHTYWSCDSGNCYIIG